nr:histone-lysine N-methyltransferase SETMAR-like [Penaeus vannamei]
MCQENQNFYYRLIKQDGTWGDHYNPETKTQSNQGNYFDSPLPRKRHITSSAGKIMLTFFWDQHGEVRLDFLAKNNTFTGSYYTLLLLKLQEAIITKEQGTLAKGVRLLQDNVPVHNSHVAQIEKWSCGYILPNPPYSLDFASSDFHLFLFLKSFFEGKTLPR